MDSIKNKFKMIYTFTVNDKPKALKADSLEDAIAKIVKSHFFSFSDRKIRFISSNDPSAPKQEMQIYTKGLYDYTRMKPVKPTKK